MSDQRGAGGWSLRPACADDAAHLRRPRTALFPTGADEHAAEIADYFAERSIDIVHAAVAVADDGQVIGFIELNLRSFAEGSRNKPVPYVEAWLVDANWRGHGIGRALIEYAEDWARGLGFRELASDAELDNHDSIARHRRLGFTEVDRVVCFLKALD